VPDDSQYGIDEMRGSERREFMVWYDEQKDEVSDNIRVLEEYCQACQIFLRDFIVIGNIEVFIEAFTIPSICNKVLRNNFIKPNTSGLIPAIRITARRHLYGSYKWNRQTIAGYYTPGTGANRNYLNYHSTV
jgi:hypothetical protein